MYLKMQSKILLPNNRNLAQVLLIVIAILFATLSGIFLASASSFMFVPLFLSIFGFVLLIMYPFLRAASLKHIDLFEPVFIFLLYIILTFFLRGLIILNEGSILIDPIYNYRSDEFKWIMTFVFSLTSLFLAAFYYGYYSTFSIQYTKFASRIYQIYLPGRNVFLIVILSLLIGLPASFLLSERIGDSVLRGEYAAATREGGLYWISYLQRTLSISTYILLAYSISNKVTYKVFFSQAIALIVSILVFLIAPSKGVVINTILMIMVLRNYLLKKISLKSITIFAIVAVVIYPFLNVYRSFGADLQTSVDWFSDLTYNPYKFIQPLISRSYGADVVVAIIKETKNIYDFEFGRTFTDILWWYVPRAWWSGKPLSFAIRFGQEYIGYSIYATNHLGVSPTLIGELYLNFSIFGILIGGWLFGRMYKWTYLYLIATKRSPISVLFYGLLLTFFATVVEGPIADQFINILITLFFTLILLLAPNVIFFQHKNNAHTKVVGGYLPSRSR